MSNTTVADFEEIRILGGASVVSDWAAVGSATSSKAIAICFTNDTEGSVFFTNDTTKSKIFVKAGGFKLWDVQANANPSDDGKVLNSQMQWYVKQAEVPSAVSGSVYIEVLV